MILTPDQEVKEPRPNKKAKFRVIYETTMDMCEDNGFEGFDGKTDQELVHYLVDEYLEHAQVPDYQRVKSDFAYINDLLGEWDILTDEYPVSIEVTLDES